jgi:CRISPR-associated protein Cas2
MRMREKLRWELEKILTKDDDLLLIRLSTQCIHDLPKYNRENTWLLDEKGYRII